MDKIVAAKSDLRNAQVDNIAQPSGDFTLEYWVNLKMKHCPQEMAFKDIFNSLPATPRFDNFTVEFDFSWCLLHRNDNLHMDGSKEIWNSNKSNLNKVRNPLAPTMFSPSTFSSLAIIGGHRNNCSKVSAKIVDCIHYFTHLMFCHLHSSSSRTLPVLSQRLQESTPSLMERKGAMGCIIRCG